MRKSLIAIILVLVIVSIVTVWPASKAEAKNYFQMISDLFCWGGGSPPPPPPDQPPVQVTSPNPANGAFGGHSTHQLLSWARASGATSYDVYHGRNPDNLLLYRGTTSNTSYIIEQTLLYNARYYWRIDSVNEFGTTTGNVWNFSTQCNPDPVSDQCEHFNWDDGYGDYFSWGSSPQSITEIHYKIDTNTTYFPNYLTLANFRTAVTQVLDNWKNFTGGRIDFKYDGECTNCVQNTDGTSAIGFYPIDNAGTTRYRLPYPSATDGYNKPIKKLSEVDVQLHSNLQSLFGNQCGENECKWVIVDEGQNIGAKNFDLKGVLTHEIGHLLGLDEMGDTGESLLSMYQSPTVTWYAGKTFRQSLGIGDKKGSHCIYAEQLSDRCQGGLNN
jgi:hypothetical protein